MIGFIAGILTTVLIVVMCGLSYWLGTKHAPKVKAVQATKEEKDDAKEKQEHLMNLLNYDISRAYDAKRGGK